MSAAGEDSIFGAQVMGKKTTLTTISLDSKAGDKTKAITPSVQRVNSAFKYNDITLQSLDKEDRRPAMGARKHRRKSSL